jgi:CRP-like cAMP-binding protein
VTLPPFFDAESVLPEPTKILQRMLDKVERRANLDDGDREALLNLPYRLVKAEPGRYLVREGASTDHSMIINSGLAYRHKFTADGSRQIVSIHIPGDFVDLEGSLLNVSDHNVQALTRCEIATVPTAAVRALVDAHPRIARALWVDTLIDGSIFREWIMNIGRRDARERLAHLFCEFARRLEVAGLGSSNGYELPMTQEQLADSTGLTAVHVNRTLKAMDAEGLIERQRRFVFIPDWEKLRDVAGFSELYLHLDQVNGGGWHPQQERRGQDLNSARLGRLSDD